MRDMGLVKNDEPVERLFTQGMVIKGGAKMSKSLGNVVSPDEMIARFGADARECTACSRTSRIANSIGRTKESKAFDDFLGRVYRFVARNAQPDDPDWRKPVPAELSR